MLDRLEEDPFRPNSKRGGNEEFKIMEECLWITNLQAMAYWTISGVSIVSTVAYTMIRRIQDNNYQELAYGPFTVLNTTYSPNYEITCLYQGVCIFHLGMLLCTTDLLFVGILAHISYQFRILSNYLRCIVQISYDKMVKDINGCSDPKLKDCSKTIDPSRIPWKYLKQSLKEATNYHTSITDIANDLEDTFNGLLLFVFLGTLMVAGFLILRSSQIPLNDGRFLLNIGEAAAVCMQVLAFCYWGEEMVFQSQQIGMAAYQSDFLSTDLRFQKCLVLIMRRNLNHTKITAGKFAPIRLMTFVWILRSAYSAFIILKKSEL